MKPENSPCSLWGFCVQIFFRVRTKLNVSFNIYLLLFYQVIRRLHVFVHKVNTALAHYCAVLKIVGALEYNGGWVIIKTSSVGKGCF